MAIFTATIQRTKAAETAGECQRTSVDDARDAADILVVGHVRKRTEIRSRRLLGGAGIKMIKTINGVATYLVTNEVLDHLRRRYSVATDF